MAVALIGGGSFGSACAALEEELLALSKADEVVVIAAAAAFEHPERQVAAAAARLERAGVAVRDLGVTGRAQALDPDVAAGLDGARYVHLTGGSPMHLRSVLKDTPLWDAIVAVDARGGLVAADGESTTVVTDPMTDPRGGAFTLGLGLVTSLAVLASHETWSSERSRRTRELAPRGICVAALDTGAGLVRSAGGWRVVGSGTVGLYMDGRTVGQEQLPRVDQRA